MFNLNENTKVEYIFNLKELLKNLKSSTKIKEDMQVIDEIKLTNTFSQEKTNLTPSENVNEIYVITIMLNNRVVPHLFLEEFNKIINFQTVFQLKFRYEIKYISSIKIFTEEKMKVLKTYETNWQEDTPIELDTLINLEDTFEQIIAKITKTPFQPGEDFEEYVSRLNNITKLKSIIEKQTKIMHSEKQPNLKMAINDKLKQMKKELETMEE